MDTAIISRGTSQPNTIAVCPRCSTKLRVPSGKVGIVTCPFAAGGCGTKFRHPAAERSTVALKCACDGRAFGVTFQRKAGEQRFTIETIAPAGKDGSGSPETAAYNADIYDWTSFYCGCCGYAPDQGSVKFVHCGRCHSLICGSQTYQRADEGGGALTWFVCHPDCGHEGRAAGRIQEYAATRGSVSEVVPSGYLKGGPPPLQIK